MHKEEIIETFKELQDYICNRLAEIDGQGSFEEDLWTREEGGGGRTRIFREGKVIEKGGVNFSEVYGKVSDQMKANTEITADEFLATGVSIVLHPFSPHVPIIHMNVRYFELSDGKHWFGGGIDLTPHFIVPEQAGVFHRDIKEICDEFDPEWYPRFKEWADNYFYLPHRDETRGVGGIFFDHLSSHKGLPKEKLTEFCDRLGRIFPELYAYQIKCGIDLPVKKEHEIWQNIRRGRYVEFNLVHDRGTKFGLVSGGRTESILMSMPPNASWEYQFDNHSIAGAEDTVSLLKKNIDWSSK